MVEQPSQNTGDLRTAVLPSLLPLEMNAVTKRYGSRPVLDRLTLRVERGEIVALLGPNGAGKSTTLALSLGFVAPDAGTLTVAGVDVARAPQTARGHVAYLSENVQLYSTLSGLENLQYFTALGGRRLPEEALRAALSRAGLPEAAHRRRVAEYSKGMRQKAGIAIALARRCDLLLLDEPTSGLDPIASDEFNQLLRQTSAEGVGILMATHDLGRVLDISDRVLILRGGRLAASFERSQFRGVDLQSVYSDAMHGVPADA